MFSYPTYQFMLDFPLAAWADRNQITDIETLAAQALSDWLLSDAQQANAMRHGLRPADGIGNEAVTLFTTAEPFGIALSADTGIPVQPPSRSEASGLVQWFAQR
jgi:hypothetical protein